MFLQSYFGLIATISVFLSSEPSVLEYKFKKKALVRTYGPATARVLDNTDDPKPKSSNPSILYFIRQSDGKYLIKSINDRFLCAKPRDSGVIFCKKSTDPNTQWIIEQDFGKEELTLKTKGGRCLKRLNNKDKRKSSFGNFLNVNKCNLKKDLWIIRPLKEKKKKTEEDEEDDFYDVPFSKPPDDFNFFPLNFHDNYGIPPPSQGFGFPFSWW